MIDWNKSATLNKMSVDNLKLWFEKYPNSGRQIIAICNNCDTIRKLYFNQYRDLCRSCVHKLPGAREAAKLKTIEQFSNQKAKNEQAERAKKWYKDHPEWGEKHSNRMKEYNKDPEFRKLNSDRIKNSDAVKLEHQKQKGGNDIVQHHYLYDHDDLSLNTVGMTRSDHTSLHRLLQKLGYNIQHINKGDK